MYKHFFGIVEDRNDPLQIGRVRVRVYGIHTDVKDRISSADLPWAQVLLPTTSAGISGMGTQHGLVEGSTVYGFFRDGESCQDPVIIASSAGYPVDGTKETTTDELISRTTELGFNDPRRLTVDDYKETADGPNPPQDSRRTHGLTRAMDTAPKAPDSLDIKYDSTGSTITEYEVKEEDLPWYPLYTNDSDLSSLARGATLDHAIKEPTVPEGEEAPERPEEEKILDDFVDIEAEPMYPYNKVIQSESGHIIEIDDTVGKERLNVHHRSGTFHEIHPDGSEVTRIVNNNYTAILKDDKLYVAGNVDLQVGYGNVTINVSTGNVVTNVAKGNVDMTVAEGNVTSTITKGNFTGTIGGTTDVTSAGKITITNTGGGGEDEDGDTNAGIELKADKIQMTGALHVTGAQTNKSTIVADGTITDSGATLATHKHKTKVASGSSSGTYESEKPS